MAARGSPVGRITTRPIRRSGPTCGRSALSVHPHFVTTGTRESCSLVARHGSFCEALSQAGPSLGQDSLGFRRCRDRCEMATIAIDVKLFVSAEAAPGRRSGDHDPIGCQVLRGGRDCSVAQGGARGVASWWAEALGGDGRSGWRRPRRRPVSLGAGEAPNDGVVVQPLNDNGATRRFSTAALECKLQR